MLTTLIRRATSAFGMLSDSSDSDLSEDLTYCLGSRPEDAAASSNSRYCATVLSDDLTTDHEFVLAWKQLEEKMALVPAGDVRLAEPFQPMDKGANPLDSGVPVQAFYVDRFAVTNRDFAEFMAAGGYNQEHLWPSQVLPHVLQFLDKTGQPGPRGWSQGSPPADRLDHPVVGVSWFEASAFATWAGKRLPTPCEWQRAANWASDTMTAQGIYPWGDSFDPDRANIWHSRRRATVPVGEYENGSTPNGVHQMVGNTWEWTAHGFESRREGGLRVIFDRPMAEIRGGAFDTYLETQATCLFRTAQPVLSRAINVGFRCCIGATDLPAPPDPSAFIELEEL